MHLTSSVCVSVREMFENESPVYYSFHFPSSYANLVISHIQLHLSDFIRRAWNQNIITLHTSISRMTSRFLRLWPPASRLNSTVLFLPLLLSQTVDTAYIFLPPPCFLQCCALLKSRRAEGVSTVYQWWMLHVTGRAVFLNMTPLVL